MSPGLVLLLSEPNHLNHLQPPQLPQSTSAPSQFTGELQVPTSTVGHPLCLLPRTPKQLLLLASKSTILPMTTMPYGRTEPELYLSNPRQVIQHNGRSLQQTSSLGTPCQLLKRRPRKMPRTS